MKIYWNGERKNVIGSRVKELRKKQDISQKILAARLSLSGIDLLLYIFLILHPKL